MNLKLLCIINLLIDTTLFTLFIYVFFSLFKNVIPQENVFFIAVVLYFLYYFLQEYFFKKTIGKFITKTEVISTLENKKYFVWQIVVRTLIRCIIVDIISYLFTDKGFHDLFSKTQTVKTTKVEFRDH